MDKVVKVMSSDIASIWVAPFVIGALLIAIPFFISRNKGNKAKKEPLIQLGKFKEGKHY